MSLIQRTKKSFFGVLISLVVAPFETFNIMINHEAIRYSWSILALFCIISLSPELYIVETQKLGLYLPNFIYSFVLVLILTVFFYAIFLRILFYIFRLNTTTWRTINGSFYLFSVYIFFIFCTYIYNYIYLPDSYSLVFIPREKVLLIKNTRFYYSLLAYICIFFALLQSFALTRALGKLSNAGTFIVGFASFIPLIAGHVFAITVSKYIIPDAKDLFIQFLFSPFTVIYR